MNDYDRMLTYSNLAELLNKIIELADRSVQQKLASNEIVGMRTVVSLLQVALSLLQLLDQDLFDAMKHVRQRNAKHLAEMIMRITANTPDEVPIDER